MSLRTLPLTLPLVLLTGSLLLNPSAGSAQPTPPTQAAASTPTGSAWQKLGAGEKLALAPLASRWDELTETQRSKWRAIARQFAQLTPDEQSVMHARMSEWVALSPAQRNQARLNFHTVQNLPKDEKKTKWDEYQALSETQKRELSSGTLSPSKTAAPSAKPANAERLVQPAVRTLPPAAIPARQPIDKNTLLPRPSAAPGASSASDSPGKTSSPASEPAVGREAS